jgi:hypothetical protein
VPGRRIGELQATPISRPPSRSCVECSSQPDGWSWENSSSTRTLSAFGACGRAQKKPAFGSSVTSVARCLATSLASAAAALTHVIRQPRHPLRVEPARTPPRAMQRLDDVVVGGFVRSNGSVLGPRGRIDQADRFCDRDRRPQACLRSLHAGVHGSRLQGCASASTPGASKASGDQYVALRSTSVLPTLFGPVPLGVADDA